MRGLGQVFRVWKWTMVVLGLVATVAAAFGQDHILHPVGPLPTFDVATIKPSPDGAGFGGYRTPGSGIFNMSGVSLLDIVMYAYGLGNSNELAGGPGWAGSKRFDVRAVLSDADIAAMGKMTRDDQNEQVRLRMQALLAQRFRLEVSFPRKVLQVYTAVVAKGGLRCTKSTEAPPSFASRRSRFPVPPPPPPPPPPGSAPEVRTVPQRQFHFNMKGWPLWFVVLTIGNNPTIGGRIVIDKTGVEGNYDCDLTWVPDGADVAGPSFFTATEEQLGIKFVPVKLSVDTVMIESVEMPSEN